MASFADFQTDNPFLPRKQRATSVQSVLDSTRPDAAESPLQDESLLGSIGRSTLSGLARVGHLLDTPGSMSRDVLTLHNPFDNLLHPTTDENRITGRDMLRQWGLVGQEDTTPNWWLGLGAELATDPFSWATFGAKTAVGKAAQAAGKLTPGLKAGISAGEKSLMSLGIPFTEHALHYGTGAAAQKFAGYADNALSAVANSPPGRVAQGLFHASAMGEFDPTRQALAKQIHPAQALATQKATADVLEHLKPMQEAEHAFDSIYGPEIRARATQGMKAGPATEKIANDMARFTFGEIYKLQAELGGHVDEALGEYMLDPRKLPPALGQQLRGLGDSMQKTARTILDERLAKGGYGGTLEDVADMEHLASYANYSDAERESLMRMVKTIPGSASHRTDVTALIPRPIVNKLASDPLTRELEPAVRKHLETQLGRKLTDKEESAEVAKYITSRYGKYLGKGTMPDPANAAQRIPIWNTAADHAEAIQGWAKQHLERPIFTNPPMEDFMRNVRQGHVANLVTDVVHDTVQKSMGHLAPPMNLTSGIPTGNPRVLLPDLYERFAGLHPDRALNHLASLTGRTVDELKKLSVPSEIANALGSAREMNSNPQWFGVLGDLVDRFTRMFTGGVTLPFPGFHGRNLTSGQYVNLTSGLMPTFQHVQRYAQHAIEALASLRTGKIDPALEREIMTHSVFNPRLLGEGVESHAFERFGTAIPGSPFDARQTWDEAGQSVANTGGSFADRIPGLTGARKAGEFVMGTGSKVAQNIEFMNRVGMYKYLKAEGWDAAAAAKKVRELQVNYDAGSFSPFENQAVRRLIPFYKFQRGIAPVILKNLLERPGGLMGQTIRGARLASGNDASLPDHVQETLAVENPFKSPTDGTRSFLTGFGLPFEGMFAYGGGGVRGAGREVLSQLNPLVKAPLEWSTNQSFFQRGSNGAGRPLEDLNPTVGQTIANIANRFGAGMTGPAPTPRSLEFLLANSPASRFLTTARQLSDPRKSPLDLLLANTTGIRVTDVSPSAQDAILKDRAADMMRSMDARSFEKIFFRPQELEAMSPEQRQKAERLMQLQNALATRAKDRMKQKKAASM